MYLFERTIQEIRDILVEDHEKLEQNINKFVELTLHEKKI